MQARGEIVKKVVQESGLSVSRLAQKIGISRAQLYNDFSNPEMSIDRILAIGRVLHYDFSEQLRDIPRTLVQAMNGQPGPAAFQLQECQEKLLEVQSQLITALQTLDRYKSKYGPELT
ncbi:MAG: helix-turn-helix domain-containing protein [Janthinobacterium lividum]